MHKYFDTGSITHVSRCEECQTSLNSTVTAGMLEAHYSGLDVYLHFERMWRRSEYQAV